MSIVAAKFRVNARAGDVAPSTLLRVQRRAEPRHIVGDLQRVARRRALVEHRRGEAREAGLVRRIRVAAVLDDEVRGDDRHVVPLDQDQLEAVGERRRQRRLQIAAPLAGPPFGGLARHA